MGTAVVHCDGAYNHASGIGGYGCTIQVQNKLIEFSERCEGVTTPARAEMLGAIRAIQVAGPRSDRIQIYSDAKYVVDGASKYLKKWIASNWEKEISNQDLWFQISGLCKRFTIEWFWVKSHNGDYWNERADTLAKEAVQGLT
jgi:ribonuclease HI